MAQLEDAIQSCLYAALRRSGVAVSFDQVEAFRTDCQQLAKAIREQAQEESRAVARKLQAAITDAVKLIEEDIDTLSKKVAMVERLAHIDQKLLENNCNNPGCDLHGEEGLTED